MRLLLVVLFCLSGGCHVMLPLDSKKTNTSGGDAAGKDGAAPEDALAIEAPTPTDPDLGVDLMADIGSADLLRPDLRPDLPPPDLSTADLPPPDMPPPDMPPPDKPQGPFPYSATIAACTSPAPNKAGTAYCENDTGTNEMSVDKKDDSEKIPFHSYVSFEIDAKLVGFTPTKVTLQLHTTNNSKANADQTGEVWQVSQFTMSSLDQQAPTSLVMLAANKGAIGANQLVEWDLSPATVVQPNTILYLGIIPVSTSGVNYWNKNGLKPPKLIIQ
jgi:hypothetical protein